MADTVRHGQTDNIEDLMIALASAQGEFPEVPKSREGKIKGLYKKGPNTGNKYEYTFKYADISDILKVVRPVLSKWKIAFLQMPYEENGNLRLKTSLYFGPQCIWCDAPVSPLAGIDFKDIGAAMTYARRVYGAPMLGVAAEEDTIDRNGMDKDVIDGDDAGPGKPIEKPTNGRNKFLDENCFFDTDISAEYRVNLIAQMQNIETLAELKKWAAEVKPTKDQLQPNDSEAVVTEFKAIEANLAAKKLKEMLDTNNYQGQQGEGPKTVVTSGKLS